jgi:hypothetical protein
MFWDKSPKKNGWKVARFANKKNRFHPVTTISTLTRYEVRKNSGSAHFKSEAF